jgi:hypothetical protein
MKTLTPSNTPSLHRLTPKSFKIELCLETQSREAAKEVKQKKMQITRKQLVRIKPSTTVHFDLEVSGTEVGSNGNGVKMCS